MNIKEVPKEKAIKRYEGFIRFVLRKPSRYTKANLARADLLRRNICKNGGTIIDAEKAYRRAIVRIDEERKLREQRVAIKQQQLRGW